MIILIFLRETFASFYTKDIQVFNIATHLLLFAAIFQIPDGIQMGSLGALRGYKDTFIPMIYLIISYWIFAIPFGYFLTNYGFTGALGAEGMWIGMIIGLSIFSILSILRLRWVTRKSLRFSI